MKKNKYLLLLIGAIIILPQLLFAFPNAIFNRSLPNQAGVSYEFLYGNWDFITTPAYYTMLKNDALSAVYTPDLDGVDKFVFGGRNTIGLPVYWALGIKDGGNSNSENNGTNTYTYDKIDREYSLNLGTNFGNFGIGVYSQFAAFGYDSKDVNQAYSSSVTPTAYTANTDYSLRENNAGNRFGVNLGQNFEEGSAWGIGLGYSMYGGASKAQTDLSTFKEGRKTVVGDNNIPFNSIDFSAFGWTPISKEGNLIGTSLSLNYQTGKETSTDTVAGVKQEQYETHLTKMNPTIAIFHTIALPIAKLSTFYLTQEISFAYEKNKIEVDHNLSGGAANVNKLTKTQTNYALNFNLPIVFQLPVDEKKTFNLNIGWYPKIILFNKDKTDTETYTGTTVTTTVENAEKMKTDLNTYGFGITYKPVANLAIHFLARQNNDRIGIDEFNFGVDYNFESTVQ